VRLRSVATVVALIVSFALAGCSSTVVSGTTIRIASSQAFYSANPKTSYGNSAANNTVASATNSQFNYYDNTPRLVRDTSFGSYRVVSRDPLTVKYTIAAGVTWSDGVPVDAADMLLSWAANSGALNTTSFDDSAYVDRETGKYSRPFPPSVVHFDGFSGNGLQLVTKTPVIGDGGRSPTPSYDRFLLAPKLAKIARFWDTGFNISAARPDKDLLVGTGPYTVTDFVPGDHVTLTANPRYTGAHRPSLERVTIRYIADPLAAVEAFRRGEVDVVSPQPTEDVVKQLVSVDNATILSGFDGAYEHLDLQFDHGKNGTFADPAVRRAFLKTVPRQQILDSLVVPVQEDAQLRSSQVFLPGSTGYQSAVRSNGSREYSRVDIAGAKAILATAGVASPEVCVLFDPSNPRRVAEFGLIQKSAALAGFAVTDCSSTDWRQLLGTAGAYDASLYALRPSSLAVSAVAASFRSDSTIDNSNFYANPQVDGLIDSLDSTVDRSAQIAILHKVDSLVWADAYGVPLYQFPSVTAFNDRVAGIAPSPLAPNLLWNIWAWTPVKPAK